MTDIDYMKMALQLAASAKGRTSPNPLVGAVVVKNQRIIGLGAHLRAGKEHAEVHALNMAGRDAEGSTMYVTLEPCNHYGKTPPCTEKMITEGVKKVYIATMDPNPKVMGEGIKALRAAGVEVEVGLLEEEANRLNEVYNKYIISKQPFIILKTAMTLDGKIATKNGDSQWITNEQSRLKVHQIRNEVDAILVGINTVISDDSLLTTRLPQGGRNPIRIIIDSRLSIPETAKVLDVKVAPTIIICTEDRDRAKEKRIESMGVKVFVHQSKNGHVDLKKCMEQLGELGITSILVEGGSEIHGSFLSEGIYDKFIFFIAPKIIGGKLAITTFGGSGFDYMNQAIELTDMSLEQFDRDLCITGYPIKNRIQE